MKKRKPLRLRNNDMRFWSALLCAFLLAAPTLAQQAMPPDEGGDELADEPVATPKTPAKAVPPAATPPASPAADAKPKQEYNTVILQGLNKVTGHMSKFNALVGKVEKFGNLEILAHRCWQASPEDRPENAALLEIHELKTGEDASTPFIGWMFSSSPGLSALEHPVYDVTVLSCAETPMEKPAEKVRAPSAPSSK